MHGPARVALLIALSLGGCSASTGIPDDGQVDIGGRSLHVACSGTGAPAVVLEAGLGIDSSTWSRLLPLIEGDTRVCTYDRAGQGSSDAAETPRTAGAVVDDLDHLLDRAGIAMPVVLVGHSFGGLAVRLYAARHPERVAGIVLIDATPPTLLEDTCELTSATRCAQLTSMLSPQGNPEGIDWAGSIAELDAAGPAPNVPLVVLAATEHGTGDVTAAELERWEARAQALADSVPDGRLVAVDSGHFIHLDRPEAVADALRSVLGSLVEPSPG